MIVIAYLHVNLFRIYGKDTATELNNDIKIQIQTYLHVVD